MGVIFSTSELVVKKYYKIFEPVPRTGLYGDVLPSNIEVWKRSLIIEGQNLDYIEYQKYNNFGYKFLD